MLIVLAGLPGVGKTTIARALARQLPAVHVRIDSATVNLAEAVHVILAARRTAPR